VHGNESGLVSHSRDHRRQKLRERLPPLWRLWVEAECRSPGKTASRQVSRCKTITERTRLVPEPLHRRSTRIDRLACGKGYPRAAWKAKRRDGVEHIACLAAGEAMEQQPSATWADAQRWRRVGMRGTAAHGAPGCPVSAECLDDGAAAVGAAGELGIVKGHGVLAVRDAPRAASSAPQK
jgi:hypothetical protein